MAIITAKNRTRRTEVRTTLMEIHPFFGRQKGRKITEMNPSGRRDTGIARIRKRRVPRGRCLSAGLFFYSVYTKYVICQYAFCIMRQNFFPFLKKQAYRLSYSVSPAHFPLYERVL